MPLDDDDNPTLSLSSSLNPPNGSSQTPAATTEDAPTPEDLLEDEGPSSQDFRLFKKNAHVSAQTIRKGEKDFESHGTLLQTNALEASRNAMGEVLSYTRVHASSGNLVRGWVFPEWWEGYSETREEGKAWGHIRDRVVVLEGSNTATQNLGRAVTGQEKGKPARGRDWLLPEEALYLVERGSLDLWWPKVGLEVVFPVEKAKTEEGVQGEEGEGEEEEEEGDEYAKGLPLSLQAAYALLIGEDGERGKVSLRQFQVYSNLKRCGYNVLRAPPKTEQAEQTKNGLGFWEWFTEILGSATTTKPKPFGPLVQPGLHRSYASIYRQMSLVPFHKPSATVTSEAEPPFEIHYHVWKSAQKWTKLRHPPPDFYLSVVDAQETNVPELGEISALIEATPLAPGKPEWTGPGRIYARLKHGHRNVLVAVVDHGVINYMRFAEAAFGEEKIYERFDTRNTGGNKGKGGGRGGRRGGRGGGRGGKSSGSRGRTGR
ncbi:putative tRNA-splicing endonuclease subunit tsp-5 [Cladorrhinum samala]|uniref:tRNA-splicing endonuclease subunit tsp-5 n=1 Tax=Cladorrhinum samala TaxID=585594 RepID=A0AAV9HH23_9PEZI|nr:putative tRNA-splicing endonuclease subunit tsp-5 [Cladorrhinum samala]